MHPNSIEMPLDVRADSSIEQSEHGWSHSLQTILLLDALQHWDMFQVAKYNKHNFIFDYFSMHAQTLQPMNNRESFYWEWVWMY